LKNQQDNDASLNPGTWIEDPGYSEYKLFISHTRGTRAKGSFMKLLYRMTLAHHAITVLASLSFILQINCQGPEGPVGPQGPKGDKGPAGTTNVQYSGWFSPSSWTSSPDLVSSFYFETIAPAITQNIIDSGVVVAYIKMAKDSGLVRPLPATPTSGALVFWNYDLPSAGMIRFTFSTNDDSFTPTTADKFRYVVISGGVRLGKRMNLMVHDYEALREIYHIAD
jgi:hypothetical protein